ncbi:protein-glutamate O-methyltransferase CheR [Paenibacillus sp. TRM 82003]|uniref:CheR family methyltransferase n=1 Tax=Kineococcus sp. TRM81007 TaxID=2925831 RepID=UPI001F5AEA23|nr:protein-glutamate O-methyltransferase CheR [Kineococcus sp. TRM81007]MCI2238053.1 protein-glutamate O-methyltransferase CheR [Kineococcus sp. TRM81007]MCI3926068.1 protein-glutamate O-methyltransferase CheR [Paenibacillus sp. TRM 82003]
MALTPTAFEWVCALVRKESAIVLEKGKEYLVESRLVPLARAAGAADVSAYVDGVRLRPDRRTQVAIVEALTTNETSWFRDGAPFQAFATTVVPALKQSRATTRSVRIWSAASSTGQEPYSLAIGLQDSLIAEGWRAEIVATDLSTEVLEKAKAGTYSQLEVNRGLPAPLLVRHFTRAGMNWQVNANIRQMVRFQQLNLTGSYAALGQFDVVFLRNVLIYFDLATKRDILGRVRRALKPDGYLFLGGAETTLGVDDNWERQLIGRVSVHRPKN